MEQRYARGIRTALITALLLVFIALLIGLFWDWVTALAFIIGGTFITLCCFLSYYRRIAFSFNSIPDTNMSSMVAFLTNSIPSRDMTSRSASESETFKPFTFQQDKDKELEDMRVRALLRQVFPDEKVS